MWVPLYIYSHTYLAKEESSEAFNSMCGGGVLVITLPLK